MPVNQRRCHAGHFVGVDTITWGDDESEFLLFYSAYRPDSLFHKTSLRRTTRCCCGAYRICLLVSALCYLFGSMGATRLRQCEGILLRTARGLLLYSPIAISRRYYSRIAGLSALLRADGYRAHIHCDSKATNLVGTGLPDASDHDWFRHSCARVS